ncbi:MAG: class I SAM-dependent methyltransferase [Solirubrobacteraceae bacterium]
MVVGRGGVKASAGPASLLPLRHRVQITAAQAPPPMRPHAACDAESVEFRPTTEAWNAHADGWLRWARTPGHDHHYEHLNLPALLALLPSPGRLTVDLACGEGRLGRVLSERGHSVIGVDSSPTLVRLAREAASGPLPLATTPRTDMSMSSNGAA